MSLIEVGEQIAKIVEDENTDILVKYLVPYKKSDKLFRFEKNIHKIKKDNITNFYDTTDIALLGYSKVDSNLYEYDEGSDYVPSSSDESEYDDISCVDSDEEYLSN